MLRHSLLYKQQQTKQAKEKLYYITEHIYVEGQLFTQDCLMIW